PGTGRVRVGAPARAGRVLHRPDRPVAHAQRHPGRGGVRLFPRPGPGRGRRGGPDGPAAHPAGDAGPLPLPADPLGGGGRWGPGARAAGGPGDPGHRGPVRAGRAGLRRAGRVVGRGVAPVTAPATGPAGHPVTTSPIDPATGSAAGPAAVVADPAAPERRSGRARWCLGTRLLVAATLIWVVFLALHAVLSGRWWFWLVVELAPPILLVIVPLPLLMVTPLA